MQTTTKTPRAATPDPATGTRSPHKQGADLLQALTARLSTQGYRRTAVDTWRNDTNGHHIRHAYCNGEWTLTCWHDGGGALEVRYSVRATMPTVEELFNSTAAAPF